MKTTITVLGVLFFTAVFAAPPDPTIVSSNDLQWSEGSLDGVTIKQFPGELGHMNIVRYAADTLFPAHSHVNEQILMVRSGRYRIAVEGTDHVLEVGDVIVIPSYSVHEVEALVDSSHIEFFAPADLKPRPAE